MSSTIREVLRNLWDPGFSRHRWGTSGHNPDPPGFAGLHGLRHIFLTEAGGCTHPFTLQYVAGHDSIKTTMRYVHPQANAVQDLFPKLAGLPGKQFFCGMDGSAGSVQNPVQPQLPLTGCTGKWLKIKQFLRAEVVKLADTPS